MDTLAKMIRRSLLAALLVAAVGIVGCGAAKGKSQAELGVTIFHKQFNQQKLDEIWSTADQGFRDAATRKDYETLMKAVTKKLGQVSRTSTVNWTVRTTNFQSYVVLTQNTEFEQGEAQETFTFRITDGKAKLFGYHIQSLQLIADDET